MFVVIAAALAAAFGFSSARAQTACEFPGGAVFDVYAKSTFYSLQSGASDDFKKSDEEYQRTSTAMPTFSNQAAPGRAPIAGIFVFPLSGGPSLGTGIDATRLEIDSFGNSVCTDWDSIQPRDGTVATVSMYEVFDSQSLVEKQRLIIGPYPGNLDKWFTNLTNIVAVDVPMTSDTPPFKTSERLMSFNYTTTDDIPPQYNLYDESCEVVGAANGVLTSTCTGQYRFVTYNGKEGSDKTSSSRTWAYSPQFKSLLPLVIPQNAFDSKIGDAPWHSQTISAALTPTQRKAANDLFAQGFDLYKGGDFTGAQTLIGKGLETDPANYLAWFTLGEINRAAWRTKGDRDAARTAWFDYRRVIDLAPKDDAKALLATNYLKPGGMN
jgi:hypothetical protein